MPWMNKRDDPRKDMYFHPIDYKDAMKDGWLVIDPPRGENLSEYMPITPSQAAVAPPVPEGATIAGGVQTVTEDPSPADDAPTEVAPSTEVSPATVDLKADTKVPEVKADTKTLSVKTDKEPRNTETSRTDFSGRKKK